ncbi:dUTP pyrophosphatase [Bajunvirus bajun]|uniref:dUTP diphosphatase n=1 Tax=Brevundimonas phage vB_BgoS-Bajun TaxID=2948594 RepID=A0A9E7N7B2_9CAUD|nr:dUTP pyrophosphatase [Brevundimonas phage vB_BgoS-Bajun]
MATNSYVTFKRIDHQERAHRLAKRMREAGYGTVEVLYGAEDRVGVAQIDGSVAVFTWEAIDAMIPHERKVKFSVMKVRPSATIPTRGSPNSAGLDLHYDGDTPLEFYSGSRHIIPTGIAMTPPEGCYGRIAGRSGLAAKQGLDVIGGVVDADYTGEIRVVLVSGTRDEVFVIQPGDRVAQIIFEQCVIAEPDEVAALDTTERGQGGFGSTGS